MAVTLHWQDTDINVHKLVVGPLDNNVFVLQCRHTGESVLLDAANEHEKLLELCTSLDVRTVLETHGHWDHIGAVTEVRDAGYNVGIAEADAKMLPSYDYILTHEDVIQVGDMKLAVHHTPGHTPGSLSFKVVDKPLLFSGDTLFPGGPGRTDFDHSDFKTIITSIETLFHYPKSTLVLPGHGDDTTIGNEQPHIQTWVDRGW